MTGLGDQVDQLQRLWHIHNVTGLYDAWEFAGVVTDEHGHGNEPAALGQGCNHPSHVLARLAWAAVATAVEAALLSGLTAEQLRDELHQRTMSDVEVAKAFELHAAWREQQQ